MIRGEPLYPKNDAEARVAVTRKNVNTGTDEPATGLSMNFWLAATSTGTAIDASLEVTAFERAGNPGHYYGVFEGTAIDAVLNNATYVGHDVFQIFGNGADIQSVIRRRVKKERTTDAG